jgi:hypothetical protein
MLGRAQDQRKKDAEYLRLLAAKEGQLGSRQDKATVKIKMMDKEMEHMKADGSRVTPYAN